MLHRSSLPAPTRLFLPGCALAAGLLLLAPRAQAAPAQTASAQNADSLPAMMLRVGKTATYPLPPKTTFTIEAGALNIFSEIKGNTLALKALSAGAVRLRLNTPGKPARVIALHIVEASAPVSAVDAPPAEAKAPDAPAAAPSSAGFGSQTISPAAALETAGDAAPATSPGSSAAQAVAAAVVKTLASPQIVERAVVPGTQPQRATLASETTSAAPTSAAPTSAAPTPAPTAQSPLVGTPFELFPPEFGGPNPPVSSAPTPAPPAANAPTSASPTSEFPANPLPPQNLPPQNFPPDQTAPTPQYVPQQSAGNALGTGAGQQLGAPLPPAPPSAIAPSAQQSADATPVVRAPLSSNTSSTPGGAHISPPLPAPATGMRPRVTYQTTPKLPPGYNQLSATNGVEVTQGLARLLTFQNNILSVFFSDPTAMDARAINARTIAVTGTAPGQSTLAVFTARYPGDAVGYPSVYRITTLARGESAPTLARDAGTVEAAITAALGDPRIRVSVVKLPDNSLAARLTGVVRNEAEVQGALTTASFFAPRVLPSVYADTNAPSLDAVLSGVVQQTPQGMLEDNLRRITGNPNIELIPMPGSLILKAEVDSQQSAEKLMELLPSLNQPVVPFITIRGGGMVESSNIPLLQGEDLQLTQKLQAVTGVRTVYAVRAAGSSVAIYGTVRTRGEYEAVKRYGLVITQVAAPALPAYDPAAGYGRSLGVQMFVRILDAADAVIRNVTIETNIVEISRNNLKNLGAEYGSATLTGETITRGGRTPRLDANGGPVLDTNGNPLFDTTPGSVSRTVDQGLNLGTQLLGNGFVGTGGLSTINPFRIRVNAATQNNNARVLASPNIRATEGTVAQITIGGERPVPSASASFGSNAQSVEFRRFGVILTMRPTVSDDNTIILQIRADVTQPDSTYSINLGGAIIPGESVRSIDTTITVRPGDIVVMGGLLTNDKRQLTSKVPILGDIPILGSLFRSKRFENNETELAIFMTPRIDAIPATLNTMEIGSRIPSYPALPGRQESNAALAPQR